LRERVESLENQLGEASDKHARALETAHAKVEHLHGRVLACEKHGGALTDIRKAHTGLASEKAVLDAQHGTLKERLDQLEQLHGVTAGEHARELQALKAAQARLAGESKALKTDVLAQEKEAREAHHASVQERLDYLEGLLGDSAERHDKHARALETLKASHGELASRSKGLEGSHTSAAESIQQLRSHIEDVHSHSSSLNERLTALQTALGEQPEKHGKLLEEAIRGVHTKQARELEGLRRVHSELRRAQEEQEASTRERLVAEREAREAHHDGVQERMAILDRQIGDAAERQGKDLESIKAAHEARFSGEAKARDAQQGALAERLGRLEGLLSSHADKQSNELREAHAKLDQVHERLGACERSGPRLDDKFDELQKAQAHIVHEHERRGDHHLSLKDRVDYLEKAIVDSAERNLGGIESLKASHSKLVLEAKSQESQHASLAERLSYVEKAFNDSHDRHGQDLAATKATLDQVQGRIASCEAFEGALEHLKQAHESLKQGHISLANDKAASDTHHMQRADFLEKSLGELTERQAQEAEVTRDRFSEMQSRLSEEQAARTSLINDMLGKEKEGRTALHASTQERLAGLEQFVGLSADKHTRELQERTGSIQARVDELEQKLVVEMAQSRDHVQQAKASKTQQDAAIAQGFENERIAREQFLAEVHSVLEGEKKAREVQERLAQEGLARERSALERRHEILEEHFQTESRAREDMYSNLHAMMIQEKTSREQSQAAYEELLISQRSSHSNSPSPERGDRSRRAGARHRVEPRDETPQPPVHRSLGLGEDGSAGSLGERVQNLQRRTGVLDEMLRKEISDRTKESKRLWDAIDTHSHDFSSSTPGSGLDRRGRASPTERRSSLRVGTEGDAEAPETYLPFPVQPLTSFLRLGGQGFAESPTSAKTKPSFRTPEYGRTA